MLTIPFEGRDVPVINDSGMPDALILQGTREIAQALDMWSRDLRRTPGSTLANRAIYEAPEDVYGQMLLARYAAEADDVVAAALDLTQSLALQGVAWESTEADEADVFNQLAADMELDRMLRTLWRELATYGQVTVAFWWEQKTYQVRGFALPAEDPAVDQSNPLPRGRKRRKSYTFLAPAAWTILDPLRVVPVGHGLFGMDPLAWSANTYEMMQYDLQLDPLMQTLFLGPYEPDMYERQWLSQYGFGAFNQLLLLDPGNVFRLTMVKPDYHRFATVPLLSVFDLLDLKKQLKEADRTSLVGSANYILVVKVGSDAIPGKQPEIDSMQHQLNTSVKLPVIVSDQRLSVEIVTPARDSTLVNEKYDVLDSRILARMLSVPAQSESTRSETTGSLRAGALSKSLESKRHLLRRDLERKIAKAIVEHPSNVGVFKSEPNLAFVPRQVQVTTDQSELAAVMTMRARNEISRDTTLEYLGFDQEVEARRRVSEQMSGYDEVFKTAIPFNSPQMPTPGEPGTNPTSATGSGRPPKAVSPTQVNEPTPEAPK